MEQIMILLVLLRLVIPIAVFKWPLPGAIASMMADAIDYPIFGHTIGVPSYYALYDKVLDTYYLSFEFIVSLRWVSFSRSISIVLYVCRLAGLFLFALLRVDAFLFFFPNVFEFFFIFELLRLKYFGRSAWTLRRAAIAIFFLSLLKLSMEYAQHVRYVNYFTWIKSFLF